MSKQVGRPIKLNEHTSKLKKGTYARGVDIDLRKSLMPGIFIRATGSLQEKCPITTLKNVAISLKNVVIAYSVITVTFMKNVTVGLVANDIVTFCHYI